MIKPDKYYSAFEISYMNLIPHATTTKTVVTWLEKYRAKYPDRVIVRPFPTYKRKNGTEVKNRRYSILGENLISLLTHIEDGSI